jgi:hypothetical protein
VQKVSVDKVSVAFTDILERMFHENQLDEKRIYNIDRSEFSTVQINARKGLL